MPESVQPLLNIRMDLCIFPPSSSLSASSLYKYIYAYYHGDEHKVRMKKGKGSNTRGIILVQNFRLRIRWKIMSVLILWFSTCQHWKNWLFSLSPIFSLKKIEMLGVLLFMHSKNTIQLAIIFLIYTTLCKQGRNFLWNVALLI